MAPGCQVDHTAGNPHSSHCFGGTSLYTCFRLVPLFLQNRKSITGRRAHSNPPGRLPPPGVLLCLWKTNRHLAGVDMMRSSKMASERSTDVQAFIGELDGGVETKIGAVLQ
ncbi:hypothetical protein KCP70_15300 [Salmonella enterica subsp. enterica]|nr:hypothetical protein KCP70_15300 [Salmonella enterica subsp. enterica]